MRNLKAVGGKITIAHADGGRGEGIGGEMTAYSSWETMSTTRQWHSIFKVLREINLSA